MSLDFLEDYSKRCFGSRSFENHRYRAMNESELDLASLGHSCEFIEEIVHCGRLFKEEYWHASDGRCLRPRDMTSDHLINTIKYLHHRITIMIEPMRQLSFEDLLKEAKLRLILDLERTLVYVAIVSEAFHRRLLSLKPVRDERTIQGYRKRLQGLFGKHSKSVELLFNEMEAVLGRTLAVELFSEQTQVLEIHR